MHARTLRSFALSLAAASGFAEVSKLVSTILPWLRLQFLPPAENTNPVPSRSPHGHDREYGAIVPEQLTNACQLVNVVKSNSGMTAEMGPEHTISAVIPLLLLTSRVDRRW